MEEGKKPISLWKRMSVAVKGKFSLDDYEVIMHKRLQNLRQKDLYVDFYIEDFLNVNTLLGNPREINLTC